MRFGPIMRICIVHNDMGVRLTAYMLECCFILQSRTVSIAGIEVSSSFEIGSTPSVGTNEEALVTWLLISTWRTTPNANFDGWKCRRDKLSVVLAKTSIQLRHLFSGRTLSSFPFNYGFHIRKITILEIILVAPCHTPILAWGSIMTSIEPVRLFFLRAFWAKKSDLEINHVSVSSWVMVCTR